MQTPNLLPLEDKLLNFIKENNTQVILMSVEENKAIFKLGFIEYTEKGKKLFPEETK